MLSLISLAALIVAIAVAARSVPGIVDAFVRRTVMGFAGLIMALLYSAPPVAAAALVSVPALLVARGGSAVIPVTSLSPGGPASGLQFDLLYDSAAIWVSATAGDAAGQGGKAVYAADVAPGQKRFVIAGMNQDSIPDGVLVNLFVYLRLDAPGSEYPLQVSNVVGADADGQAIAVMGANGALTVQETTPPGPSLPTMTVLNAASYLAGPVAPGEVVTLSGAGIGPATPQQPHGSATSAVLGGVSVLFDGTPSPLLYAAPDQINLVVPYEVYGKPATQLQVTRQGETLAALPVSVTDAAPAIFTLDSSGVGPGAILNQDSTVNTPSSPADKGSVISVYAAGAGQTDPPGADGQIAGDVLSKPLLHVSVQIGGLSAEVQYAGAAPALVAGVLQVNCVVPPNSPSGSIVPIVITVGQASSQPGVTLAIR